MIFVIKKTNHLLILLVNFTENFSLSFWFRFTQLKDKFQDASFVDINYKNLFCSLHMKTSMIQNQSCFKEIILSIDHYENISIEKTRNLLNKTVLYQEVKIKKNILTNLKFKEEQFSRWLDFGGFQL